MALSGEVEATELPDVVEADEVFAELLSLLLDNTSISIRSARNFLLAVLFKKLCFFLPLLFHRYRTFFTNFMTYWLIFSLEASGNFTSKNVLHESRCQRLNKIFFIVYLLGIFKSDEVYIVIIIYVRIIIL